MFDFSNKHSFITPSIFEKYNSVDWPVYDEWTLCEKLGKERFVVVPHVSSMQLAFARIKETWEDAYLTDLSARPLETVVDKIRIADTVGLFTSET